MNLDVSELEKKLAEAKEAKSLADRNCADSKLQLDGVNRNLLELKSERAMMVWALWFRKHLADDPAWFAKVRVLFLAITFGTIFIPVLVFSRSLTAASVTFIAIGLLFFAFTYRLNKAKYSNPSKRIPELDGDIVLLSKILSERQSHYGYMKQVVSTCDQQQLEVQIRIDEIIKGNEYQKKRQIAALLCSDWRELRGVPWEDFLQAALEIHGFDVETTPKSGDHGIDLVAKDGVKSIAIQAKGYLNSVGNAAVQQAFTGKAIYGCTHCAVITNSEFTSSAYHAAEKTKCLLIGGKDMVDFVEGSLDSIYEIR